MRRKHRFLALLPALVLGLGFFAIARAAHGPMASTERSSEINRALQTLLAREVAPAPEGADPSAPASWTNLQAAEWTARASERLMAQVPSELPSLDDEPGAVPAMAPSSQKAALNRDLGTLVTEFQKELAVMEVDVKAVEKKLRALEAADESMRLELKEMLPRTGAQIKGKARGYTQNLRGFGPDRARIPADSLAASYIESDFVSLPVPFLLFEAGIRVWMTYGPNYDKEPIRPEVEVRKLSLSSRTKHLSVTAGDFFKSWTPLTLWNQETVFNRVEPLPLKWRRADAEEIADMDRHPDWRLRGLTLSSAVTLARGPLPLQVGCEVMGGRVRAAQEGWNFSSYWTGGRAVLGLLKDHLEFSGAGLMLLDDPESANVVYDAAQPLTFERRQGVGSFSARLAGLKPGAGLSVEGGTEYASSRFQDDRNNRDRVLRDWAMSTSLSVASSRARIEGKYADNGPDFYSPGAQTLCDTPGSAPFHHENARYQDFNLVGLRNRFLFQDFQRPFFTPYSREIEMIWPYGDATPNRKGFTAALSVSLGKSNWIKPLLSFTGAKEVHANFVIDPVTAQSRAVDSMTNTAEARSYSGFEGVLDLDLTEKGKRLAWKRLQLGYKTQKGTGNGADLKSGTFTGALDFGVPGKRFTSLGFTLGASSNQADGSDYFQADGTAQHHSLLDGDALGAYARQTIHTRRVTYLMGTQYTVNPAVSIRMDWTWTSRTRRDEPDYDNREQFWRLGYEARF